MRIERIKARNFKSFEDLDETLGDITIISGRNSVGKSTFLDIVYAAFITEGDRNLLRVGADEGEFTIYLRDDNGETFEVRRTLKPGKVSAPTVKSSKSGTMGAAASFLKTLVDTATLDPIRVVMALPPAEQAKILLETLPLTLDHAELAAAVSQTWGTSLENSLLLGIPNLTAIIYNAKKLPALDALKAVEDCVFDQRKLVNRDVKTQMAHASQLRAAVGPADDGKELAAEAAAVAERLEVVIESEAGEKSEILQSCNFSDHAAKASCEADIAKLKEKADKAIADIQERLTAESARLRGERDNKLQHIQRRYAEMREAVTEKYSTEREELKVKRAQIQERVIRQSGAIETKRNAQAAESQAADSKAKSDAMSKALDAIKDIRAKLLESLPIPGLSVEGGQIYLKGVALQEVNTAQQGKFWIGIAVRRAIDKGLGTVIIDDAEHFDDVTFPMILESCKQSGLQFIIGRVAPHPFKVEKWSAEE